MRFRWSCISFNFEDVDRKVALPGIELWQVLSAGRHVANQRVETLESH
jgi:hypothetical protein